MNLDLNKNDREVNIQYHENYTLKKEKHEKKNQKKMVKVKKTNQEWSQHADKLKCQAID